MQYCDIFSVSCRGSIYRDIESVFKNVLYQFWSYFFKPSLFWATLPLGQSEWTRDDPMTPVWLGVKLLLDAFSQVEVRTDLS